MGNAQANADAKDLITYAMLPDIKLTNRDNIKYTPPVPPPKRQPEAKLTMPTEPVRLEFPDGLNKDSQDAFFIKSVEMHPRCPPKLRKQCKKLWYDAAKAWSFG